MFLFLLVFQLSCVNENIVPIKMGDSKLVLNAVLSPEQEIAIHLSRSFVSGNKLSDAELKEPAIVHVYFNNQFRGDMIPDITEPEEENYVRIKGRYFLPGVKPLAGDEIRIEAEAEGYPTAVVTIRIPESPVLLSVDTVRYSDAKYKEKIRLYVKIEDKKDQRNYYRMLLSRILIENGVEGGESFPTPNGYYYYGYSSGSYYGSWMVDYEDPVFRADLPIPSIGSARINEYGVFADNLFDGKEYVLKLSFADLMGGYESDTVDIQAKYNVKLLSISESYYLYYKQNSSLFLSVGHIQLVPVMDNYISYSNVENGFGLVFAYNETKYEIDMAYVDY